MPWESALGRQVPITSGLENQQGVNPGALKNQHGLTPGELQASKKPRLHTAYDLTHFKTHQRGSLVKSACTIYKGYLLISACVPKEQGSAGNFSGRKSNGGCHFGGPPSAKLFQCQWVPVLTLSIYLASTAHLTLAFPCRSISPIPLNPAGTPPDPLYLAGNLSGNHPDTPSGHP